jgi:hypothetical protein
MNRIEQRLGSLIAYCMALADTYFNGSGTWKCFPKS